MKKLAAAAQETYCTTREAAEMLHVSLRTVQLWVESGVLKAWKTDGGHRRLPLSSVQELVRQRLGQTGAAVPAPAPAREGFKVLVLEDDEDTLKLYKLTLSTWQLPVHVDYVSSVFEALIVIGRDAPDLLITDLKMQGVDGFEIIKLLRNDQALGALDIVVISGLDAHEIEEKGGLPPDITVFTKPVSFEQLQGYIRACLAHRNAKDRQGNET